MVCSYTCHSIFRLANIRIRKESKSLDTTIPIEPETVLTPILRQDPTDLEGVLTFGEFLCRILQETGRSPDQEPARQKLAALLVRSQDPSGLRIDKVEGVKINVSTPGIQRIFRMREVSRYDQTFIVSGQGAVLVHMNPCEDERGGYIISIVLRPIRR